jgi:hypothetical protein
MNRLIAGAGKVLTGAAKVRTIMLAYYAGIATGCFIMAAWVAIIHFAPQVALGLIQQVSGVL